MGAIVYEMVTGRRAFDAPNTPAMLYRICYGEPDSMDKHRADAPPELISLIESALSRDPQARLTDASAMRVGLRFALGGMSQYAELTDAERYMPKDGNAVRTFQDLEWASTLQDPEPRAPRSRRRLVTLGLGLGLGLTASAAFGLVLSLRRGIEPPMALAIPTTAPVAIAAAPMPPSPAPAVTVEAPVPKHEPPSLARKKTTTKRKPKIAMAQKPIRRRGLAD
jgi:serine/threonine protein kinase